MLIEWVNMFYGLKISKLNLFFLIIIIVLFVFFVVYDFYWFVDVKPVRIVWLDDISTKAPIVEKNFNIAENKVIILVVVGLVLFLWAGYLDRANNGW